MGAIGFGAVANFLREAFIGRRPATINVIGPDRIRLDGASATIYQADGTSRTEKKAEHILLPGQTLVADGRRYRRVDAHGNVSALPPVKTRMQKAFAKFGKPKPSVETYTPNTIMAEAASFPERAAAAVHDPHFVAGLAATGGVAFVVDTGFEQFGEWRGKRKQARKDAENGGEVQGPHDPNHPVAATIANNSALSAITTNPLLNLPFG